MKRNILLLTGNGFLGKNLIDNLNKKQNTIYIYAKRKKKFKTPKNVKVFKEDIFNIRKIQIKNSIIILTTLNNINKNFEEKFKKLLNKIILSKPLKIILISSVSVYAKKQSLYSKNCKIAEKYCKLKFKNLIVLRAGNIFGENKTKPSYIEKLLIASINNLNLIENKLNLKRSYIHIEEFCKAISKIIQKNTKKYKLYNLSNKNYILSSYQIKQLLIKKLKLKISLKKKKIFVNIIRSVIYSKKFEKDFNFKFENKFLKRLINLRNYYEKCYFNKNSF